MHSMIADLVVLGQRTRSMSAMNSCTIFEPSVGILVLRSLLGKDLANEATDPAAAPKDEEDLPQ